MSSGSRYRVPPPLPPQQCVTGSFRLTDALSAWTPFARHLISDRFALWFLTTEEQILKTYPAPAPRTAAPRWALPAALLGAFGGFTSFYLLLSVVPEYALHGGAGPSGAGLTTGALMATTVAVQPLVPRLQRAWGRSATLALGGVLLGLPCLALNLSDTLPALLALSLLRGCGFGVVVVIGVAAVADLTPTSQWGRGLGLYGAVVGTAGIIGSPLGLWMVHRSGYSLVFIAGAVAAVGVLVAAIRTAPVHPASARTHIRLRSAVRPLALPFLIEAASTTAYGVVFTFLPSTLESSPDWTAPVALLVVQATCTVTRLFSGGLIDRLGGPTLLVPAIAMTAAGMCGSVFRHDPLVVIAGAALFGAGFGVIQNATLVVMLRASQHAGVEIGSVAWNLAFDAGTGVGAVAGGLVLGAAGHASLFLGTAALLAVSATAVRRGKEPGTPGPDF
ncbi:MFS transporter [Streptomyces hyaluromycini]|uniref:MFS transporter n=1 Tax=Streptomyces hyaluromycini TaxID=1377993 RepID=A0ABV1WRD7_9ACTN